MRDSSSMCIPSVQPNLWASVPLTLSTWPTGPPINYYCLSPALLLSSLTPFRPCTKSRQRTRSRRSIGSAPTLGLPLSLIRSLSPSRSLARTRGPGIRKSGNADRRGWRCEPVIGLVRERIRCRTTAAVAASSSHYSSSRSQWRTSTDAR
jgi:hypothetical protein